MVVNDNDLGIAYYFKPKPSEPLPFSNVLLPDTKHRTRDTETMVDKYAPMEPIDATVFEQLSVENALLVSLTQTSISFLFLLLFLAYRALR